MTPGQAVAVFAGLALLAAVLTDVVRRITARLGMLDRPNERSSHLRPTPRGGGLAMVAVMLPATGWFLLADRQDQPLGLALVGGGALVAGVGWLDDRYHLSSGVRLVVHFAAATWAVWLLGGLPEIRIGHHTLSLGPIGGIIAVVGVVWLLNLYNFMDGIDGLAGGIAVVAGLAGAVGLGMTATNGASLAALVAAAASLGFLVWNWHPARIFMGDIGSGLLGYWFAVIAIAGEQGGGPGIVGWMILLAVFVVDATVTLVRRMRRGERWAAAHRQHAYQRLSRAGWSHAGVSALALLLTGLLGIAVLAATRRPEWMLAALISSFTVVIAGYLLVERVAPFEGRADSSV